jgi:hypothetical protein
VLFASGLLLGASGAVVQAGTTRVGSVALPWGVVAVLGTLVVTVRGACWWLGSRLGGLVVAVGWLLASLVFAGNGPGGDLLLPDDWTSRGYLLGGAVLAMLTLLAGLPAVDRDRFRGDLRRPMTPE